MAKGTLYLVVGPSGSGKDTLIDAARKARPDLHFVQRAITRPRNAGGESHTPYTPEEFAAEKRMNGFVLAWDAHGYRYGVPASLTERLAAGQSAVLGASRFVVNEARALFDPLRIVHVTARLDDLARRLRERGREDAEEIEGRIARATRDAPRGPDVVTIDNSGTIEQGIAAFLAVLSPHPAKETS